MLLLSRVAKLRPGQEPFIPDLQMLTAFITNLRDVLDSQTLRREFKVDGQEVFQTLLLTDHTGAAGRPRYANSGCLINCDKKIWKILPLCYKHVIAMSSCKI